MILGALELEKKLRALSEMELRQGIEKGISFVQEDAKANCPVYDGELRESIFTEVEKREDLIRGTCYTNKRYAPYVEFGTGPQRARPIMTASPRMSRCPTVKPAGGFTKARSGGMLLSVITFFHIDTGKTGAFISATARRPSLLCTRR